MAASMASHNLKKNLTTNPICEYLKRNNPNIARKQVQKELLNVLAIHGSDLFVWDFSDSSIIHTNLRRECLVTECLLDSQKSSSTNNKGETPKGNKKDSNFFQKLILGQTHGFETEAVTINRCCSHLLVWGHHGIRIVELPRRWGAGAVFEGGKNIINCRTISLGGRYFGGNSSLSIHHAKWHPGSHTNSHVAVLTSDNMFRVYDINDPDQPVSLVPVSSLENSVSESPSKIFVGSALGEVAVSFDFGSPITLKPKQNAYGKNKNVPIVEVWPVYCVRGNGEVMLVYSHLSNYSSIRLPVHGPLSLYPPAEDNYGVDACSILCLDTPMPILAISTRSGRLHHCVQLDTGDEDDGNTSIQSEHNLTCSSPGHSLFQPLPEPILYVVESVELELCLSLSQPDSFICPIQLQNDINSHDRYYCIHKAGVHSVALPWLSAVQQYFLDETDQIELSEEKECIVEHLFCTKPIQSCPSCPVLGVDVVSDPVLGPTLVILSSLYEFTALPIGVQYQSNTSLSSKEEKSSLSHSNQTPSLPFSQHIAQILQRKISNPLLRSSSQVEPSQQEAFQVLSRATQILREEYIEKQDQARDEIDSRISILRDLKKQQLQDIEKLKITSEMLTENARHVAEKLNERAENYDTLKQRIDNILHKLQNRVPNLSEAERNLTKELKAIQTCIQGYKTDIGAVRTKLEYQERQLKKKVSTASPVLQEKQLNQIKTILKEEANEIEDLKKDINKISKEVC